MAKTTQALRPRTGPGAKPVHLRSVTIEELGPFERLSIAAPHPADDIGQWIVLLGNNGAGKTSFLRAVALALQGYNAAIMHLSILGHPFVRDHASEGQAIVDTTRGEHRLRASRGPIDIPIDAATAPRKVDLFAYGSGRGTAMGSRDRDVDLGSHRSAVTLFSSHEKLIHAETWLRRQRLDAEVIPGGRARFDRLLATLASLLPGGEQIAFDGSEISIVSPSGARTPFASMSDGYLTTLGWTLDLVARWVLKHPEAARGSDVTADMPCVVLVDEIDLHLHPRWQLDIIPRLRAAFPKTTFVVTTHNPLTLQGTRAGEVFVLHKDDATGRISITQRDVPPGTDANRLLTGDWFGLGSTLDESTLKLLDDHRAMLLAGRPETDPLRLEVEARLRQRLGHFADTSYERMAQSVVAEVLDAKMRSRGDITDADRQRVVQEVRARLAALDAAGAEEAGPTWAPRATTAKAPRTRARAKPSAKTKAKRSPARRKP